MAQSSIEQKYPLAIAQAIAADLVAQLAPHCHRCEIAGSVRRQKEMVKDVEIVCIPKPYETGLFASGIALVASQWTKVKGDFPCLYTQRFLPNGMKLDLFIATHDNWGYIYALRTGSREFNFRWLMVLKSKGYKMHDGGIYANGHFVATPDEAKVFSLAGIDFVEPEKRS